MKFKKYDKWYKISYKATRSPWYGTRGFFFFLKKNTLQYWGSRYKLSTILQCTYCSIPPDVHHCSHPDLAGSSADNPQLPLLLLLWLYSSRWLFSVLFILKRFRDFTLWQKEDKWIAASYCHCPEQWMFCITGIFCSPLKLWLNPVPMAFELGEAEYWEAAFAHLPCLDMRSRRSM